MGPLNVLIEMFILDRRDKRKWPYDQPKGGGDTVKQISVWPMAIMLVCIILLVIWLRPH